MVLLESFNTQDVQQTRRLNDILSWDLLNAKHVGYFFAVHEGKHFIRCSSIKTTTGC